MSGAVIDGNGDITDQGTVANVEAVQTANTHTGTPNQDLVVAYNGATISFFNSIPFIADLGLYAAIGASNPLVTWND
jgi:hypothetical protein